MTLYEAIVEALDQARWMYENTGDFTSEDYKEMVRPLHQALLNASNQPTLDESLVMRETYDGVVVDACDDTAILIYDVGEDRVEQTYHQSQFIGKRLPAKGTRLRVQVEVFELPADQKDS